MKVYIISVCEDFGEDERLLYATLDKFAADWWVIVNKTRFAPDKHFKVTTVEMLD
jgi:hypothetical protein